MPDPVYLVVGGKQFGGWTEATIEASSSDATRSFTVVTSERFPDWPIKPQDEVTVMTGGDILVKGIVDDYDVELDATSHQATITGRSKSREAVDNTAKHKTGRFKKKTIEEIGKELAKEYPGLEIKSKAKKLEKIEKFQLNMGETIFTALERIARKQNLMLVGAADGSLEIRDAPENAVEGTIREDRALRISVSISGKDRHQEYVVKAQRAFSDIAKDLKIEEKSVDKAVTRKRVRTILAEGDTTKEEAKKRADNEKTTQQGRSIKATVKVTGFRNEGGKVWAPLMKVFLWAPTCHLEQTMAIESLTFHKSATDQTYTELNLVDPKAVKGKGDSRSKSDKAYSQE